MFESYRLINISEYNDRRNKSDSIAVYDTDTLGGNKDLFVRSLRERKIPFKYFNGNNTDKLFIGVQLSNTATKTKFIRFLKAYKNYTGLTRAERQYLNNIRKGYYLSKKGKDKPERKNRA